MLSRGICALEIERRRYGTDSSVQNRRLGEMHGSQMVWVPKRKDAISVNMVPKTHYFLKS